MSTIVLIRSNAVSPDPPVEKVASCLLKNGYKVIILGWDRDGNYGEKGKEIDVVGGKVPLILFGIPAKFGAGYKSTIALAKFQYRLLYWLKRNKNLYDIIHAFDFDTALIANKCAKKYKKKLVYHILDFYVDSHGLNGHYLGRIIKKAEIKIIDSANAVIICTEQRKKQIKGSHPKKLAIIHNTPYNSNFLGKDFKLQSKLSRYRIVYVGILAKGRFIDKIAEVVANDKRFEFHIGGYGILEQRMQNYANKNDNIFFYGKLSYEETLSLEKQCDIMTAIYDPSIPNHKYAAPNKFYESLMLGKPVIMAKGTGFDELVEKEKIGCVIEYSIEGLKNGLNELLDEKKEWEGMGEHSRDLYNKYYSWTIMENRLMRLYHQIESDKIEV